MSLKANSPNTVELSNAERRNNIIGVIGSKPLIELNDDEKSVQVVTSGVTDTLVSDINGEVKTGDKITASPIDGIGMKATESSLIVGTAQADLGGAQTTTRTVTDSNGTQNQVKIGTIPVQVNVTFNTPPESEAYLPAFLQDFANNVAGKEVSPVRVLLATGILLVSFVSIVALLYASVRSSIISIGRNPLSEIAVRRGLFQIAATAVGILLLTLVTIYLILST